MVRLQKWSKLFAKLEYMLKIILILSTPYTIRARELMQIYNTITMKFLTLDERLDILLTLKHTVKVCSSYSNTGNKQKK